MKVVLETNYGEIEITLNKEKAPITVENFLNYVESGHYDGTIFHRIINDFMIQGGGFDKDMQEKPTKAPIKNEANNGLKNDRYTVAMARTMDPHSATGQFFINVKNNDFLNFSAENTHGWGYAVFGIVTNGQEIIDKIKEVKTASKGMYDDVPVDVVIINTAKIVEYA